VGVERRDADSWETGDIDGSVGVDDVGWLGADLCGCSLAGREVDLRFIALGWCSGLDGTSKSVSESEDMDGGSEIEATVCSNWLNHCDGSDESKRCGGE